MQTSLKRSPTPDNRRVVPAVPVNERISRRLGVFMQFPRCVTLTLTLYRQIQRLHQMRSKYMDQVFESAEGTDHETGGTVEN